MCPVGTKFALSGREKIEEHGGEGVKVLLTGARGNLARAIAAASDWHIVPLNREDWSDLGGLCSGASGGLRDGARVDAILHAAFDLGTRFLDDPTGFVESNILTTARLLDATRKHGISRFYYVSSAAVYSGGHFYGTVKKLNERMVRSVCEDAGVVFASFRIFNLFGGDDRFSVVHRLDRAVRGSAPFVLNNSGNEWRDFIHVDDAARAIVAVVNSGRGLGEIDVGTGRAVRVADIVEIARRAAPRMQIIDATVEDSAKFSCADMSMLREVADAPSVNLPCWLAERYGLGTVANPGAHHLAPSA